MKELEYIPDNNHLDLTDRVAIEIGLARKESFAKIAEKLKKHPRTIAREVKYNRTHLPAGYPFGNDCKHFNACYWKQMEGYNESQESYSSLFEDKNKYNAIMSALAGVIYREMRGKETV